MFLEYIFAFIFSWNMVLTIVSIWLVFTSVFIVRGKTAAILETFGKPHDRARMPGLHFKLPWPITSVVAVVNLQLQEIEADVSVKTKDNAFMTLPVKAQYRASDEAIGAVKAHYELEDPETQIASYILNNVRQTASGMDMVELYANRDSMENQVQETLSERFARYGFIIENVLVDEPEPSDEVRDAFNLVIASRRMKEAAQNEAAASRIKLVGVAEAESKSKELQGKGMAKMREEMAKGLEIAMETMKKAGLTPQEAMAFLTDTNRLDTISNAATHGNMVIVDTRAGSDIPNTVAAVKAATSQPQPIKAVA
jgi:regulator of protease activity HflC (stomatin/prohibitin superfamily)